MKNIFSSDEPIRQVEPEFSNQPQRGTAPVAPNCNPFLPKHPHVELRIGEATAPGSAPKADPITGR